jgi:hypothetical protein
MGSNRRNAGKASRVAFLISPESALVTENPTVEALVYHLIPDIGEATTHRLYVQETRRK